MNIRFVPPGGGVHDMAETAGSPSPAGTVALGAVSHNKEVTKPGTCSNSVVRGAAGSDTKTAFPFRSWPVTMRRMCMVCSFVPLNE